MRTRDTIEIRFEETAGRGKAYAALGLAILALAGEAIGIAHGLALLLSR